MANKKISQLTPKGSALAGTDLVEVSVFNGVTYDTKSLTGANLVSGLQPTLVSGTSIKTINSTTLLGSGNVAVQPTLVSATNIKTINSTTLLGSGDIAVQPTLVSATNIKTINSTTLLGSGDIAVQPTLVSATNIKTINSTTLLGSGDLAVQPTLVSATNIKTINSTTLLGSGDIAVQPTLVSATNIKTINSTSLLGSGDIAITVPSGIFGIANTSGVYTYYATFTLAIAAAVSGQTIELFTDVVETGAVSVALKNGVNINLNGHTYEASNSGTNNSIGDNNVALTCTIFNGTIKRSGATANMFNALGLYVNNVASKITLQGVDVVSTFGYATLTTGILVGGNHLSTGAAGNYGLNCRSGSRAYRCYGYSRFSEGIRVDSADLYDSTGHSDGDAGIGTNSTAKLFNCTGRSSAGSGISLGGSGGYMQNCNGYSTSTYGILSGNPSVNCSGYSSASYGFRGTADIQSCHGYSTANSGMNIESATAKAYNCTAISTSAFAVLCKGSMYNCLAKSEWNNAAGHAVSGNSTPFSQIFNCHLEVTNASANCLNYGGLINVYFGANVYKGATTPINANITQAQTNVPDLYGNIKIG